MYKKLIICALIGLLSFMGCSGLKTVRTNKGLEGMTQERWEELKRNRFPSALEFHTRINAISIEYRPINGEGGRLVEMYPGVNIKGGNVLFNLEGFPFSCWWDANDDGKYGTKDKEMVRDLSRDGLGDGNEIFIEPKQIEFAPYLPDFEKKKKKPLEEKMRNLRRRNYEIKITDYENNDLDYMG